ncbi:hypothetical protein ACTL6U_04460 [Rhodovibrionaceae bacterium A322]
MHFRNTVRKELWLWSIASLIVLSPPAVAGSSINDLGPAFSGKLVTAFQSESGLTNQPSMRRELVSRQSDGRATLHKISNEETQTLKNGPPKPNEIIGYWKLKEWPKKDLNKVNPWPLPFQYFAFFEDGRYASIMMSADKEVQPESLDAVKATFGEKLPTYRWVKNFIVVTNPEIENYREIWGMNIFRTKVDGLPFGKGDLVMSLAGGKKGNAVYYRWLTPIE